MLDQICRNSIKINDDGTGYDKILDDNAHKEVMQNAQRQIQPKLSFINTLNYQQKTEFALSYYEKYKEQYGHYQELKKGKQEKIIRQRANIKEIEGFKIREEEIGKFDTPKRIKSRTSRK